MPNTNNQKKYASLSTLQTFLDNLETKFSNIGHKHTLSDITDYTVDSSLSSTSTNPVQNKVLNAEFDEIAVSMRALDLALDGKSDASHSHNDLYYTETEIDQKLSGKANASHSHAISEVTNLQSTINGLISDLQEELDNIPQSDWNQNDSTKLDHIKNRPFYTTDPVETIILNGTISTSGRLQSPTSIDSLTLGDMYTVVFDGVTYNNLLCADSEGLPAIGSIDFSFTDYPFAFGVQSGTAMAFVGNNSTSHSIKVIAYLSSIVPLERKYIAEHIDKFAGEKVDGKVYTVDGSQVTAGVGAEVFNDYNTNIASGRYSHAEGMNNTASGILSHAEGWSTKASGSYSHTEGQETTASEDCAHAEGWLSEATNTAAHAEGFATNATGLYSHAEGDNATASGKGAHAEGYSTDAIGNYSHAEGSNTNASSDNQHVQGKYNVVDAAGKYAHIVGNGTSNSNRVNIHTLDWNGNGWFKGDIYVGGASMDDTSASKLVKESDAKWTLIYDSGEIPAIANSISGIDVSGYNNFEILVRCYNDGDSHTTRTGSAIFTAQNGKSYQFPVWTNMFTKSISTVHVMAQFKVVDGWLVCPCASSLTSSSVDIFDSTEGGTAGNLIPTGSGMMKCASPLSTLTISNLDQNSDYYFGIGSRVMVWGWKA